MEPISTAGGSWNSPPARTCARCGANIAWDTMHYCAGNQAVPQPLTIVDQHLLTQQRIATALERIADALAPVSEALPPIQTGKRA